MAGEKTLNPDSVGLDDIGRMKPGEFRQWTFLRLNSIDGKLKEHDKRFDKVDRRFSRLESMLWGLLVGIILAILAAVL